MSLSAMSAGPNIWSRPKTSTEVSRYIDSSSVVSWLLMETPRLEGFDKSWLQMALTVVDFNVLFFETTVSSSDMALEVKA